MNRTDVKFIKLANKSMEHKCVATGYIFGVLNNKIIEDDEIFCYLYNKMEEKYKKKIVEELEKYEPKFGSLKS